MSIDELTERRRKLCEELEEDAPGCDTEGLISEITKLNILIRYAQASEGVE